MSTAAILAVAAGLCLGVAVVVAVVLVSRHRRVRPDEGWHDVEPLASDEPDDEPEDQEPRDQEPRDEGPPRLDTTMIRWDRTLPPVPPPKRREQP
jgi:hypothetical protein